MSSSLQNLPTAHRDTPYSPSSTRDIYLEPLVCGIEQQFDAILSQIQYEVVAEGHLEETKTGEMSRKQDNSNTGDQ